tara:strand:+ start:131 stop:517 length:387 start_codon:yes stop_codon:yes gene_type:complete
MAPLSPQQRRDLDDAHSNRSIELDPSGYFLIRVDAAAGELVVEHFSNDINEQGLATDPDSGEVLSCQGSGPRAALAQYRGRSAKELGMALTERSGPLPLSRLDHALYLGRELQKAEHCLEQGLDYVQD